MRRLIIFTLVTLIAVSASFPWNSMHKMTAEEILEKAIAALGGKSRISQLHSWQASGTIKVSGIPGSYGAWKKAPNKKKESIDLKISKVDTAFDGEEGWRKQEENVYPILDRDLAQLKRESLFLAWVSYRDAGVPMEFKAEEIVDGKKAFRTEFSPPDALPEEFFFDAQDFLLLKEVSQIPCFDGYHKKTVRYDDYREVDGVMLPFSIVHVSHIQIVSITIEEYRTNVALDDELFRNPIKIESDEPYKISLSTIPHLTYKSDDGVWSAGTTESWVFHVLINEKYNRPVDPESVKIELYSGDDIVKSVVLSQTSLHAVRGLNFGRAGLKELFDLRHHFSGPKSLKIDQMRYSLTVSTPSGEHLQATIDIPVTHYEQKTNMILPIKDKFVIGDGHDFNEPHKREWSQHYALDIIGLGHNYEFVKNDGKRNEDYFTWGREVIAPAYGIVVVARNDVPDNSRPGVVEREVFLKLPNPLNAFTGNNIIIDHQNGEFSFMAHLQHGSVRVKKGDRVTKGQVLGLLGNSGNSTAPHLHYHLMAKNALFKCDGLPVVFENVLMKFGGAEIRPLLKRGIYMIAK